MISSIVLRRIMLPTRVRVAETRSLLVCDGAGLGAGAGSAGVGFCTIVCLDSSAGLLPPEGCEGRRACSRPCSRLEPPPAPLDLCV